MTSDYKIRNIYFALSLNIFIGLDIYILRIVNDYL